MNSPKIFLAFCLLFCHLATHGQALIPDTDFQRIIDEYFPEGLDDNPEAYETIFNNFHNRLDLNSISREELQSLILFSDFQINNFLRYRENFGPVLSAYELRAVEGFDRSDISKLLLFCYINENPLAKTNKTFQQQLLLRYSRVFPEKEGFKKVDSLGAKFAGNADQYFIRYTFSKGNDIEGGFLLEKDVGEPLELDVDKRRYLFDFSSFHFSIKDKGILKKLVVGDYKFQASQGLIYGPLFSFGLGSSTILRSRSGARLQSSASSYEFKNFSGIAATLGKGRFSSSVLLSRVHRDATLHQNSANGTSYFKAFKTSGLHRTGSEMASARNVVENHYGINSDFTSKNRKINIGASYGFTSFSLPMGKDPAAYEHFNFAGRKNAVGGLYVNVFLKSTLLFSEYARSQSGGSGLISGITHQFDGGNALSLSFRNYQPDFHSFKSNAFSQKSGNNNEKGIYVGIKTAPAKRLIFKGYIDNYVTKWVDFKTDRPATGREWMLAADYSRYRFFQFSIAVKSISEETNAGNDASPFREISRFLRHKTTLNVLIYINEALKWKNRIQWTATRRDNARHNGFLASSGLNYEGKKLKIRGAFNVFDTDNYDNRQFVYLNSLPFAYKFGAFQNSGSNLNCTVNFYLRKNILLSFNFIQTIYKNIKEISSGLDKITGNKKAEIGAQLIVSL